MDSEKGNLRPNEALVYSLILMMTTAPRGEGCYYAGLTQMGERLNMTRPEIMNALDKLQRIGAVTKGRRKINGHICTTYQANSTWNTNNQNIPD